MSTLFKIKGTDGNLYNLTDIFSTDASASTIATAGKPYMENNTTNVLNKLHVHSTTGGGHPLQTNLCNYMFSSKDLTKYFVPKYYIRANDSPITIPAWASKVAMIIQAKGGVAGSNSNTIPISYGGNPSGGACFVGIYTINNSSRATTITIATNSSVGIGYGKIVPCFTVQFNDSSLSTVFVANGQNGGDYNGVNGAWTTATFFINPTIFGYTTAQLQTGTNIYASGGILNSTTKEGTYIGYDYFLTSYQVNQSNISIGFPVPTAANNSFRNIGYAYGAAIFWFLL